MGVGAVLAIVAAVVAVVGVHQPAPAVAQAAQPCNVFDAGIHVFEVPDGVTQIEATVFGAEGGDVISALPSPVFGQGGLGGGATGVLIPVTPGETLEIVVGGAGIDSTGAQSPAPPGGSPGGGGAGAVGAAHTSATGGGASSIRRGAQPLIVVGGGGGGAHGGSGGAGGLTGTDGTKHAGSTAGSTPGLSGGNGGAGGAGNPAIHDGGDGSAGQGGAGGGDPATLPVDGGGGGGGGADGGGGGGGGPGNGATGGGGGSSFDATGTATFQTGVQQGDGLVTLTYACPPPPPAPCNVQTFDSPGVHTFQVPAWATEIEPTVYGAQGGDVLPDTDPQSGVGGLGAGVVGLAMPVTPGEPLEVVVGGAGADASGGGAPAPPGGSPGGGGAGAVGTQFNSAGGGGASEIRRGAQALVIAGGGGGAARGGSGGHGGSVGTDGTRLSLATPAITGGRSGGSGGAGGGGTPASGINDGQDGSVGQGGTGGASVATPPTSAGGGGGGGAVGGGGGGGGAPVNVAAGGGGGSSAHATGPASYQTGVREGGGLVTIGYACAPPPPGDVLVDKRASDGRVTVGDTVTYRLVAKNNGAGQADGVVVEDRVPSRLDVRGASSTQGDCSVSGNRVRCEIGTLAASQEATVTIRAVATEAGQSTNTGVVVADRCPATGCDTDPARVTIVKPKLRVSKTAAKARVRAGNTLTYSIRVTNPSKAAVRNVRTCDLLPAGLVPVSATPKVKVSKGRYCWTAKRLGAGKSKTYEITVRALSGARGRTVNRATASSPGVRSTARAARAVRVLGDQGAGGGVTG